MAFGIEDNECIEVSLDEGEVRLAAILGGLRQVHGLMAGWQHKHGMRPDDAWRCHIEGVGAELALAKWTDTYYNGTIGRIDADDVGSYQVRFTSHPAGRLVLHPSDKGGKAYILVTGAMPRLQLRGWIWGNEGKAQLWWGDPTGGGRAAYFVPREALHKMADLPREPRP